MRRRRHLPPLPRRPRILVLGSALLVVVVALVGVVVPTGRDATAGAARSDVDETARPAVRPHRAAPPTADRVSSAALTPEGGDRYQYRPGRGSMAVRAVSTNRGGNLRTVWWPSTEPASVDQQACATWTDFGGPIAQAGIALRVRRTAGDVQALTVTNNIWSGARNGWNVHAWRRRDRRAELVGQVVLGQAFGRGVFDQPPLPWRVCARAVGATVEFKAWSLAEQEREPAWGDPRHGASFPLPSEWVYPGRAGWYVGHLRGGEQTGFESLRTRALHEPASVSLGYQVRSQASTVGRSVLQVAAGERRPVEPPAFLGPPASATPAAPVGAWAPVAPAAVGPRASAAGPAG